MINLTIKQKLVAGIVIAIIASTSLVGIVAQKKAYETLDERLTTLELPTILDRIGGEVDKEVAVLSAAAEQMSNNPFIIDAISDSYTSPEDQNVLIGQLNKLKQQHNLNDASVANRQTANYWNQDGFLRQLNKQQDGWFFGFTQSGPERMLNVFTEQNGEVKLFVNFQ